MTVEELIEELRKMPPTAVVFVMSTHTDVDGYTDMMEDTIDYVVYDQARVVMRLEA